MFFGQVLLFKISIHCTNNLRNLLLMIDHLEIAPPNLVASLLGAVRAAHVACMDHCYGHLQVVVCGSLLLNQVTLRDADRFEDISETVMVPDLSRAESLRLLTIALANARPDTPLTIAEVAALSPEQLGASHFQFQQSMRLLSCAYDAESYFSGCKQGTPPEAIAATPLQLLLYRQEHEVRRVRLSAADYALLSALQDGADFNTALAQAQAQTGISQGELAAQIGAWLSGWLQRGLITAVSPQSY